MHIVDGVFIDQSSFSQKIDQPSYFTAIDLA